MCKSQPLVPAAIHGGSPGHELVIHLMGPAALASPYHACIDLPETQKMPHQQMINILVR